MTGPRLLLIARVAGAFGVKGEVRISTYTEDPLALLRYRTLQRQDGTPCLTLTSARVAKGGIVARAKEVETREQAEALRGLKLFVSRDTLPEPDEDEFYHADLIGLAVETTENVRLGKVKAVQNFGAGDMLEIDPGQGRPSFYLPFTLAVVPEVRLAESRLIAVPPAETGDREENEA